MSRLDSYSAAIEDVITLVRSGRVGMALTVLEGLTGLVDGEMMEAMAWANELGRRGERLIRPARTPKQQRAPKRQPTPKRLSNVQWLAARIADPQLRERALAALCIDDELLDRVATGTVQLSPPQWRRLRQELG